MPETQMDYSHVPHHLHVYINKSFYENTPDYVKPYLVQSAQLQYESDQHDITRRSVYDPHDTLLYTHEEFPPYMNFIEHQYTLAGDEPPTRYAFINYVVGISGFRSHR
ncbi:hypothetical protein G6F27_013999 [Rhizopus arrhizus]|nr:hypothetical protein G6F27_013999 [Rhizopus arrhizus]